MNTRRACDAPAMTLAQSAEFYAAVRAQLVRLNRLLDEGAPDFIVASEITNLWWRYVGKCPAGIINSWFNDLVSEALRRSARCDLCGASIAPALTHIPVCERCDAGLEEFIRDAEKP